MRPLCHLAASLGAPTAGFGALSTMIGMIGVFFALSRAGFADMGAKLAYISRVGTTAGHE
jgi:hypothetical protein